MDRKPTFRNAFTLLELLVVIAITVILIGLLLPAVQKVREAAARTSTTNNLKQIGLGCQAFHDTNGYVPAGESGRNYNKNWSSRILPYVEQDGYHKSIEAGSPNRAVPIKTYLCPGRGRNGYNGVTAPAGPVTDYALNGVSFGSFATRVTLANVVGQNGSTNTVLAGEKALSTDLYNSTTLTWDECIIEGGGGCTRYGNGIFRDRVFSNTTYANNWGSPFAGGTPFVMCDGSVRFIDYSFSASAAFNSLLNYKNSRPPPAGEGPRAGPIRVLFIGNSYTQVNDLPGVLRALGKAGGNQPEFVVDSQLIGGYKLQQHLQEGIAAQKIREGEWDFVVLQEQSQTPLPQFGRDVFYYPAVHEFDKLIRARGATTVLYATWKRPDTPGVAEDWTRSFIGIGKEVQAEVVPAGIAVEKILAARSGFGFYADGGGHPTPAGTYLVACTFYATLTAKSPEGLPASIITDSGAAVGVSTNEATIVQRAAWDARNEMKERLVR